MSTLAFIGSMEIIFILGVALLLFLLPVFALIDIVKSQFDGNNKIVWVLIVLFLPLLGSILYFMIGQGQKNHSL